MNKYIEYKKYCEDRLNAFPIVFAFSNSQLQEGLNKLGVNKSEVISIGGGGFIRKSDKQNFHDLLDNFDEKLDENLEDDEFVLQMFKYEMGNHEYCITYDDEEVIEACGLDLDRFNSNERLRNLYSEARTSYLDEVNS